MKQATATSYEGTKAEIVKTLQAMQMGERISFARTCFLTRTSEGYLIQAPFDKFATSDAEKAAADILAYQYIAERSDSDARAFGILRMTDGTEEEFCGESLRGLDPDKIQGFADGYPTFHISYPGGGEVVLISASELQQYLRPTV